MVIRKSSLSKLITILFSINKVNSNLKNNTLLLCKLNRYFLNLFKMKIIRINIVVFKNMKNKMKKSKKVTNIHQIYKINLLLGRSLNQDSFIKIKFHICRMKMIRKIFSIWQSESSLSSKK
jgi:hypothetical protein